MLHCSLAIDLGVRARLLGYSAADLLAAASEISKRRLRTLDDMTTPEAEAVATELGNRIGERRATKGAAA